MIIPIPQTDLITWIQSWNVFAIVALCLIAILYAEARFGHHATKAQLMDAELAGYDVASRQMHESQEISRQNRIAEEAALRSFVRVVAARRRVYFHQLPGFVKARACDKGLRV